MKKIKINTYYIIEYLIYQTLKLAQIKFVIKIRIKNQR